MSLEQIKKHLLFYDSKVFPNFNKIHQIAITPPVSSASCERYFSTIKRIKTWLKTCMGQDKFSSLSVLNIEQDIHINNAKILKF